MKWFLSYSTSTPGRTALQLAVRLSFCLRSINVDIAQLLQHLADDDSEKVRILDSQLLALSEEQGLDVAVVNVAEVTELFKDSLLKIQLDADSNSSLSFVEATNLITQRLNHVLEICQTSPRRRRFYSMGISVSDCDLIDNVLKPDLIAYLQQSQDYMSWQPDKRTDYLVGFCVDFLMKLDDVRSSSKVDELQGQWVDILKVWLAGQTAEQIVETLQLQDWTAMDVSTLIDQLCEFSLPWGLNAISMFWETPDVSLESEADDETFAPPEIVSYFASMLRFGVHCPVATVLLASGLEKENRQAALSLSSRYTAALEIPSIFNWLRTLTEEDVRSCTDNGIWQEALWNYVGLVQSRKDYVTQPSFVSQFTTIQLEHNGVYLSPLTQGMVLVHQVEENQIHLYTPSIDYLASIKIVYIQDNMLLDALKNGQASITIRQIEEISDEVISVKLELG